MFRIYFNEKTGEFVLFRLGGFTSFRAEKFRAKDAVYLFPAEAGKRSLMRSVQNAQGNVFINGRLCQVDLKNFAVPAAVEQMLGTRAYNAIRLEMSKKP